MDDADLSLLWVNTKSPTIRKLIEEIHRLRDDVQEAQADATYWRERAEEYERDHADY